MEWEALKGLWRALLRGGTSSTGFIVPMSEFEWLVGRRIRRQGSMWSCRLFSELVAPVLPMGGLQGESSMRRRREVCREVADCYGNNVEAWFIVRLAYLKAKTRREEKKSRYDVVIPSLKLRSQLHVSQPQVRVLKAEVGGRWCRR